MNNGVIFGFSSPEKPFGSFPVDGLLHGESLVVVAVAAPAPHAGRHLAPVHPGRLEDHLPQLNPHRV